MLKEVDDKTKVLGYAMSGIPIYRHNVKCGKCGTVFEKPQ